MKKVSYLNVDIKNGFWKKKLDMISDVTVEAVYNRFAETHRFSALDCLWKEGDPDMPHIFWDSDVAKWIEGFAYSLKNKPNAQMEKLCDEAIEKICKNADENGYFNSHFLVTGKRFTLREEHELYCLGHLIEAAVAYYEATGKRALLDAMCKYADYVEKVFVKEKSAPYVTPGHPEIELALVKLYEVTGEKRYLELSKFFVDNHGACGDRAPYKGTNLYYNQDEVPVRERNTAEGHCVRALYLLSGMCDISDYYGDEELKAACERVFDNVVNKRMYITGATGSTCHGESFTVDYHLPNRIAYAETCASISLAFFANRMLKENPVNKYADAVEKVMYNGILAGISMDGKSFFYENPLEIDAKFNNVNTCTDGGERYPITQRKEVFDCSCCPPNVIRFIASIGDYMYTYSDDAIYVHQFIDSQSEIDGNVVTQVTDYPSEDTLKIIVENNNKKQIAVRIPGWCKSFTASEKYCEKNGYAYFDLCNGTNEITISFNMNVVFVKANRKTHVNAGKVAVMRGPVVYCMEGVDNGEDIHSISLGKTTDFAPCQKDFIVPSISGKGYIEKETDALYYIDDGEMEEKEIKLIPYFAYANRGETDMLVWINN